MSEVGSMYPLRSTLNQYERSMVGFHSHPGDSAAILAFLHWTPAGDLPHHRRYPKALLLSSVAFFVTVAGVRALTWSILRGLKPISIDFPIFDSSSKRILRSLDSQQF